MYELRRLTEAIINVAVVAGVKEEPDGDREEAYGAHGQGRGHQLPRRAARQDHRNLLTIKLPVRHQL